MRSVVVHVGLDQPGHLEVEHVHDQLDRAVRTLVVPIGLVTDRLRAVRLAHDLLELLSRADHRGHVGPRARQGDGGLPERQP